MKGDDPTRCADCHAYLTGYREVYRCEACKRLVGIPRPRDDARAVIVERCRVQQAEWLAATRSSQPGVTR